MRITIDTDKVDNDVGTDGLLYLTSLYLHTPINCDTFEKLNNQGLIYTESMKDGFPYDVRETIESMQIVEHSYADMEITGNNEDERFTRLADKLRELFPTGKKEGTVYQWRDSTKVIAQRLKAFVKRYNVTYTDKQYVDATKRYVESFNGNYRFMQLLKYFIYKNVNEGGINTVNSQLLSYLENTEDEHVNSEWTANLI